MNGLAQTREFVFRARREILLTLVAGLVIVIGLPIPVVMADTVPLMREASQSCPYINRDTAPGRIEELQGRLRERNKAIEKTKTMLPGLQEGSREAWTRADRIMSGAPANLANSFAGDYLKTTRSIKRRIRAMRTSGMSNEKIDFWLKSMNGLEDAGSFLKKAPASFEAGTKFGLDHQAEMANLQKEIIRTNELFVNSGLAEELGGEFASKIGGPLGKLAFDAGVISIDLIATTEEAFIEAEAARRVQNAIDSMEWAYARDEGEMLRLDALLASDCGKAEEQVAESNKPPEPPPPSVVEETSVTTAPASTDGAGAAAVGTVVILGGVAAAGAAALAVGLSGLSTATDCGSPPQGFGSAWWADYSDWCTCMNGTPVVSTNQCIQ